MKLFTPARLLVALGACLAVVLFAVNPGAGPGRAAIASSHAGAAVQAAAAGTPNPSGGSSSSPSTIVVTGTSTIFTSADMAMLAFGVQRQNASAQKAQSDAMNVVNTTVTRLNKLGVSSSDIQVSYVGLTPQGGSGHISGYTADEIIQVSVHGLKMVGNVVDAAVGAGMNRNVNITYGLSNGNSAHKQALRSAVLEAKMRATTVADALARNINTARVQELTEPEIVSQPVVEQTSAYLGPIALNRSSIFGGTLRVTETVKLIYSF